MRKTVVVSLLALSLSIPAAPALAASASRLGSHNRPAAGAKHADHPKPDHPKPDHPKPAHPKPGRTQFVAAGRLVSVDPAAGTLTVTVHGGREKALRGHTLTVTVTAATRIRRNATGAALTDLLPGDHLNVKGTKTATTYTATRISAEATDTPEPTPSSPVPTTTATPEPTTTTPAPTTTTPEPTPTTSAAATDAA
jgi:hypothetical protein